MKPDPDRSESAASPSKRDGSSLELVVKSQDSGEVRFRIKSTTPLQKVFNAWGKKKGVNAELYRFLSEGVRVQPEQTPEQLGLEDGDSLDAMITQEGGGF